MRKTTQCYYKCLILHRHNFLVSSIKDNGMNTLDLNSIADNNECLKDDAFEELKKRKREDDFPLPLIKPVVNVQQPNDANHEIVKGVTQLKSLVLNYSGISKRGFYPGLPYKKNQDAFLILEHAPSHSFICACLDGHGEFGDVVAQLFKFKLESDLCLHPLFLTNLQRAVEEVLFNIEKQILQDVSIDTKMSGTTMNLFIIREHRILVANIGDSRAVLAFRNEDGEIEQLRLSKDHKPGEPEEFDRIIASGGSVHANGYGPLRVWLGDMKLPGLAMSRSLCDKIAHLAGVISTPEFYERELDPLTDCMIISATDGLWEFMSDEEVVKLSFDTICRDGTVPKAISSLISASNEKWLKKEHVVDDTTICLVVLTGMRSGLLGI